MHERTSADRDDVRLSALLLVLEPAFVLARLLGLSLSDLEQLVRVGYFREVRGRGLSLPQVAKRLGKSLRTMTQLAKDAELGPVEKSERLQLRRKLIRLLSQKGPLAERDVVRMAPSFRADDVRTELASLLEQKLLVETDGMLSLEANLVEFVHGPSEHKLSVLQVYMQATLQLIFTRFFGMHAQQQDASEVAMLRVLSFKALRTSLRSWSEAAYEDVARGAGVLDQEAEQQQRDAKDAHVVLIAVESPEDVLFRKKPSTTA